jgi:hypothetical protein
MYKPLVLILCATIMLTPGAILADDTTPATTQSAPTTGLGPDSAVGSSNAGGSNADGSSLQGAGTSVLQTTPADAASGSAVPGVKLFEAPTAASNDLRVLLSQEADGTPQDTDSSNEGGNPVIDILIAVGVLALGVLAWVFRAPLRRAWYRLARRA